MSKDKDKDTRHNLLAESCLPIRKFDPNDRVPHIPFESRLPDYNIDRLKAINDKGEAEDDF